MSWRLALRLARREVVRRPGRALLVVLLVAIPVSGMTVAAVLFRTEQLTPAEEFRFYNYGADAAQGTAAGDAGLGGGEGPAGGQGPLVDAGAEGNGDGLSDTSGVLPAGTRTRDVRSGWVVLEGPTQRLGGAEGTDAPVEDPDFDGPYRLLAGRTPAQRGEVALTSRSARHIQAAIGDQVTISVDPAGFRSGWFDQEAVDPADMEVDDPQRVTVVGLVENARSLSATTAVVHGAQPLPHVRSEHEPVITVTRLAQLPDGVTDAQVADLVAGGWSVAPDLLDDAIAGEPTGTPNMKVIWALVIGAVVLTAAGVVIAAAFAVSARRQLTTLGQLSATGASPGLLLRALALQGTVSGVLGLLAGSGLAALILSLGRTRIEQWQDARLPAWELHLPVLAAIAVLGVTAATLAALIPARTAARIPTLAALEGRRPLAPVPRKLPATGLAAIATGLGLTALAILGAKSAHDIGVWAFVAIVGGVFQLLGACAVTPMLASRLEPFAARLRGPWRLGARSLARNRTRTGAVIAAVAAAGALAVFAAGMVKMFDARDAAQSWYELPDTALIASVYGPGSTRPEYTAPHEATLSRIEAVLPEAESFVVQRVTQEPREGEMWRIDAPEWLTPESGRRVTSAVVADERLLEAFEAPDEIREPLAAEGLVWVTTMAPPGADSPSGPVTVTLPDGSELPAARVDGRRFQIGYGELLMSPDMVESLNLATEDLAMAFQTPEPLTDDQRSVLSTLGASGTGAGWLEIGYSLPSTDLADYPVEVLLSVAALVVALLVTGTSLALTAAESRDEREVLTIVGTRPRDLARSAGAKAGLLALLGAAVAVPLGMAQVSVVSWTAGEDFPIRPPWMVLVLMLVAVPVVVTLTARTASAVAQRVRPIHISTATFE